jgi:glycosyltransferase involved in cell wall biosynthesis
MSSTRSKPASGESAIAVEEIAPTGPGAPGKPEEPAQRLCIAFAMPPWFDVPPPAYGGIESLAGDLIGALIERGHTIFMVGVGTNGTAAEFRRTFDLPQAERLGQALPEVLNAALANGYLNELDIDVIHDHSLAGPLTARGRKVPTVMTAHGPCAGDMVKYYRALSLNNDANLVAISDSQRQLAPDLSWVGTVHNALKASDYPFRRDKEDFVLFMGRMSPEKGAHLAIDAARGAGRRIVLAGKVKEEIEQTYFEAEVRPRLGGDAEFIGEASMTAKKELYASAHCLVFPIRWDEPFGLVMIEAMACGTPVVALNRGSVPEVVEDGVTGFVRMEPEELPAAIEAVGAIDPLVCRQHVEERFDVSTMAAGYERVYAHIRDMDGQ